MEIPIRFRIHPGCPKRVRCSVDITPHDTGVTSAIVVSDSHGTVVDLPDLKSRLCVGRADSTPVAMRPWRVVSDHRRNSRRCRWDDLCLRRTRHRRRCHRCQPARVASHGFGRLSTSCFRQDVFQFPDSFGPRTSKEAPNSSSVIS